MTLDEILEMWSHDSKYDRTELGMESLKTPQLHHKYWKILCHERKAMKTAESVFKKLRHAKKEFYLHGRDEQTPPNWKMPPQGRLIAKELNDWLEVDDDIIAQALVLGEEMEKERLLESIIKSIFNRNFDIGRSIEWTKFVAGK